MKNNKGKKIVVAVLIIAFVALAAILGYNFNTLKNMANNAIRKKLLTVALDPSNAPYSYYSKGKWKGIDVDIAKKIAKENGQNLDVLSTNADDILETVKSGKADIGFGEKSQKDSDNKISLMDYCKDRQSIILPAGSSIRNKQDLKNKKIGVQANTRTAKRVKADYGRNNVYEYKKIGDAKKDLDSGKVDALVTDSKIAKTYAKKQKVLNYTYENNYRSIYVKKENKKLIQKTKKSLKKIKENKEVDKIIKNNMLEEYPEPEEPKRNKEEDNTETSELKVGDIVEFGSYMQGEISKSEEQTPIKWIILDKQGSKLLLLSQYGLDCKPYNEEEEEITWKECTLRSWLNNEFYNKNFTEEEKKIIQTTSVSVQHNSEFSIEYGEDVADKVFILNQDELNKYFETEKERECEPTLYALGNGVGGGNKTGKWWLRTPGFEREYASYVDKKGKIIEEGINVNCLDYMIRPALWVQIDGDEQKQQEDTGKQKTDNKESGLGENELLAITEKQAGYQMSDYLYVDMDQDGTSELIAVCQGSNGVCQTWYCSSDGKICSLVHENSPEMEDCEMLAYEVDGEVHIGINIYRELGTGGTFSILALHDEEIQVLVPNYIGYLYVTDDGDIAVEIQGYDTTYDASFDSMTGHTYKSTYIFYDGKQYKEYAASKFTEYGMSGYENIEKLKEKIESEQMGEKIEYAYYLRANGILHIQVDVTDSDGNIQYGYYTVKYSGKTLDTKLGEYTAGKMEHFFTQLPLVYPEDGEEGEEEEHNQEQSTTVDIEEGYLSSQMSTTDYKELMESIGGMSEKSSSEFSSFYAEGNNMYLGVNIDPDEDMAYTYIENTGNSAVTVFGVGIGTPKSTVQETMQQYGMIDSGNGEEFYWGDAGYFSFTYDNDTVSGYRWICGPTG